MKTCVPKLPVPPIRKNRIDPLRELAMKINPHQFLPQDPATGLNDEESRRLHDWLDPSNNDDTGLQQAIKLKDERKRRVHLDSEHKRRESLAESMKKAATVMGMEGVPQLILLQAVNKAINDLQRRKNFLELELRKRDNLAEKSKSSST